ncbi:MAG: c-type cytochrome [Xanthomonadales bacterium]|nr:c-type cytochrome [Xanthomonadales bacterium]
MSFRRKAGLLALGLAVATPLTMLSAAQAQEGDQPVAEVSAVPDQPAATAVALSDDKGPVQPGDAERGAAKAAVCAACHGMDGNAADPQYPKLAGQHERYIARMLALFKSNERQNPIMLGFAAPLSQQDMRDLGAYFSGKTALNGVADESVIGSGPNSGKKFYEVGEQIYRGGNAERGIPACAACHGPTGNGNPGPAYPHLAGQHAQYTAAQLTAFRDGQVWGTGDAANAVMSGVAARLTDEEIQSLASYIEGLHAADSGAVPLAAGTSAAH